jgi:1-phosphofructokinase family hexose kinase
MEMGARIITVGLSPAWDITCRGRNIEWGRHEYIEEQTIRPAGKALNVSKALAWMGQRSVAAGLWGRGDYPHMLRALRASWPLIDVKFTCVAGGTRQNVTVVDTTHHREMHLRNKSLLASPKTLKRLRADLATIVRKDSFCVFAGTMPDAGLLDEVIRMIKSCADRGAKIALDTSGRPLRQIVDTGSVWLIKPNVTELCELLGQEIGDSPASLSAAGRKLLDRVEVVLISRGAKGSMAVTRQGAWQGRCVGRGRVLSTVGCGDYLLAGFLKDFGDTSDPCLALKAAIKLATAKAWGWTEGNTWREVLRGTPHTERKIEVTVERT